MSKTENTVLEHGLLIFPQKARVKLPEHIFDNVRNHCDVRQGLQCPSTNGGRGIPTPRKNDPEQKFVQLIDVVVAISSGTIFL